MTNARTSGDSDMREYFRRLCIRLGDLPDTSKPSLEMAVGATLTHPRLKEPLLIYAILDFRDGELLACCPRELRDHYLGAIPVLRTVLSRPVAEWTPECLRETGLERIWWKHLSTYLAKTEWPEVERRRSSDVARKARIILESGLVSPAELAKATGYCEREIREVIWDRKSEPDDTRTQEISKAALRLAKDKRISK